MSNIRKLKSVLNKILSISCVLFMIFMTILTTYQVVMRYIIKNPSTFSEDLLSYSFVWVSLIASALVFGERDHMQVNFFLDKLPKKNKMILEVITELIILAISIFVFIYGGVKFMGVGALQESPTLGITMNLVYSILPICGVFIVLYCIINIMELIQKDKEV